MVLVLAAAVVVVVTVVDDAVLCRETLAGAIGDGVLAAAALTGEGGMDAVDEVAVLLTVSLTVLFTSSLREVSSA